MLMILIFSTFFQVLILDQVVYARLVIIARKALSYHKAVLQGHTKMKTASQTARIVLQVRTDNI